MPEAPELQIVTEFLRERLPGRAIRSANMMKPIVRSLAGDMAEDAKAASSNPSNEGASSCSSDCQAAEWSLSTRS